MAKTIATIKIILVCFFIYFCVFGIKNLKFSQAFPFTVVKVVGINKISQEEIRQVVMPFIQNGFFAIHLEELHDKIVQNPWTSKVIVQRKWPGELDINIIERTPIAIWNHDSLLSETGELFAPKNANYSNLPVLVGPLNQHILMLSYFQNINRLLQPIHVRIRELDLNAYATWKLTLDNGIVLYIGYKDVLIRVRQFVKVYPKLISEKKADILSVDLRYPNGMAVKWKGELKI